MKKRLISLLVWVVVLVIMVLFITAGKVPPKFVLYATFIILLWVGVVCYFAYKSVKKDIKLPKTLRYKVSKGSEETRQLLSRGVTSEGITCKFIETPGSLVDGEFKFYQHGEDPQEGGYVGKIVDGKKGAILEIMLSTQQVEELYVPTVDEFFEISLGGKRIV